MNQPLYKADETTGIFLGTFKNKDLYFKKESNATDPILIVKQGDEDWNCFLMPLQKVKECLTAGAFMKHSPFEECYKRYLVYRESLNCINNDVQR